jgi:hypothetical protein
MVTGPAADLEMAQALEAKARAVAGLATAQALEARAQAAVGPATARTLELETHRDCRVVVPEKREPMAILSTATS